MEGEKIPIGIFLADLRQRCENKWSESVAEVDCFLKKKVSFNLQKNLENVPQKVCFSGLIVDYLPFLNVSREL